MSELSTVSNAITRAADAVRKRAETQPHMCPCCGQIIPLPLDMLHLTPRQRRLYELVKGRMPYGITRDGLLAAMYGHEPGGGPLSVNVISVTAHNLNRRLAPYGIKVASAGPKCTGAPYRIMKVQP